MVDSVRNFVARIRNDENGLTAVEYAVLGGIIVAGLAALTTAFNTGLLGAFNRLFTSINP